MFGYLLRPDAIDVLDDPLVKKVLPRYVKIVRDELPARFQIAKRIEFELKKDFAVKQLWSEHAKLMKKFYETKQKIDDGELKLDELKIAKHSLIDLKILLTRGMMESCELCEHKCKINRTKGELGVCKVGDNCLISSELVHVGEESFYVPSHCIFFWSCNMRCVFCQNFTISYRIEPAIAIEPKQLAKIIETKREMGCKNCNLVGGEPTMYLLCILESLKICRANTPILWNSNMFMSEKAMQLLDGIIDVYLADFKFGPSDCAKKLTVVKNYWNVVIRNHLLAAKQTELTIRHLVLPNHISCCSFPILEWIAANIKSQCLVNAMNQYYPCYLAHQHPEINRKITDEEYQTVLKKAEELKLNIKD